MTTNIANLTPFLRTSREFPDEAKHLSLELSRTYTDIATNVNNRTIGMFTVNRALLGGEQWFVSRNQRQQNLRQVYTVTDANLIQLHGLNLTSLTNFVRIWGTFFDGTNWQTLPYVDTVSATNQINIMVNATQIVVTKGAGAPPAINNGLIILEWISSVPNVTNV